MADDEYQEAGEEQPEPAEEIDIELEEALPRRKSRRGVWFVIVLIIVLAALAVVAWYAKGAMEQAQRRVEQEQATRERGYTQQMTSIGRQLDSAVAMTDEGDIAGAIAALDQAITNLRNLSAQAQATEDALFGMARIAPKRQQAEETLEAIAAKRKELAAFARDELTRLQTALGVTPAPEKPTEEEAVEEKTPEQEAAEEKVEAATPEQPAGVAAPAEPGARSTR